MDRGRCSGRGPREDAGRPTSWGRYLDVDGDGIPYRTVVGNRHPRSAYFTRGTGHDELGRYSEDPEVWQRVLDRIAKKFETAKKYMPRPEIHPRENAKIGVIAFGSTDPAIKEAGDLLEKDGIPVDYLRLRAIPFTEEVDDFIQRHEKICVVEMNQQGQLHQLLTLAYPQYATRLHSAAHMDGLPLTARWVYDQIQSLEEK